MASSTTIETLIKSVATNHGVTVPASSRIDPRRARNDGGGGGDDSSSRFEDAPVASNDSVVVAQAETATSAQVEATAEASAAAASPASSAASSSSVMSDIPWGKVAGGGLAAAAASAGGGGGGSSGGSSGSGTATTPPAPEAPTVGILPSKTGIASGPTTYTFTFSAPVNDFTTEDINVVGGTKGAFAKTSDTVYTLLVTPTPNTTNGKITVDVAAGVATTAVGGKNQAASLTQDFDTSALTVKITDNEQGQTATGDITYTFQFSRPVKDFTADDITVSGGGTKGIFQAQSTDTYTLVVKLPSDKADTIKVDVAANVATDEFGGKNLAMQSTQEYNTIKAFDPPPTILSITDNIADGLVASGPITYTIKFSEPVTGFTVDDIAVGKGTKGSSLTPIGTTEYSLVVTPTSKDSGNVTVDIAANVVTDSAGQGNTAATQAVQPFDTRGDITPPEVKSITDNIADGLIASGPITYTIKFSEPVTGFTIDDIAVGNGTKGSSLTPIGSTDYSLVVTPTPKASGNVTVDIAANVVTDSAGQGNAAATQAVQPFDTLGDIVAPKVDAITDTTPGTATGPINYTITFSEAVKGFTQEDVKVGNGSVSSFNGSDGSTTYSMVVTPLKNFVGNITVDVPQSVATDMAGNGNVASTQAVQAVDTYESPAGKAVIDLGTNNGFLINPVQVEGKWYYYWDRSGNGSSDVGGSLNSGQDYANHDFLDNTFKYDSTFVGVNPGLNTNDTYRFATINGVRVALPTINGGEGPPRGVGNPNVEDGYLQPGTPASGTGTANNSTYNELLAIWDTHNGTGTGTSLKGVPTGWTESRYWSATPLTWGHVAIFLPDGKVSDWHDDFNKFVALQVL